MQRKNTLNKFNFNESIIVGVKIPLNELNTHYNLLRTLSLSAV